MYIQCTSSSKSIFPLYRYLHSICLIVYFSVMSEDSLYTGICPSLDISRGLPETEVCDCSGSDVFSCSVWNRNRDCMAYGDYSPGNSSQCNESYAVRLDIDI